MKPFNKVLFLLLPLTILFTQCDKISRKVNIPDGVFLNALIERGVDTNGDGLISYAEAEAIHVLYVGGEVIIDMTGVEAFINLDTLECGNNYLTNLDVSNNIALDYLGCGVNQLTSLDISNNAALTILRCGRNQLTSLSVSNNAALTTLRCGRNQLASLDVSNGTALTILRCGGNQLTNLDVSNNTALEELHISDMPTLFEVCVWMMPFPPEGVDLRKEGSPNVTFTTECNK